MDSNTLSEPMSRTWNRRDTNTSWLAFSSTSLSLPHLQSTPDSSQSIVQFTTTASFTLIQPQTTTIVHHPTKNLTDLPFDIFNKILERSGLASFTCLALTCQKLYAFLKMLHPRPVSLDEEAFVDFDRLPSREPLKRKNGVYTRFNTWFWQNRRYLEPYEYWMAVHSVPHSEEPRRVTLGILLRDWFGPRYRMAFLDVFLHSKTVFLSKVVYGSGYEQLERPCDFLMEKRLGQRYADFEYSIGKVTGSGEMVKLLPSPWNMGDEWEEMAVEAIKATLWRRDIVASLSEWEAAFWACGVFDKYKALGAFETVIDDWRWEPLTEGIKSLGLHADEM